MLPDGTVDHAPVADLGNHAFVYRPDRPSLISHGQDPILSSGVKFYPAQATH